MIHQLKGFNTVNKAEVDGFLELSCFFSDPADVAMWQFDLWFSAFSKSSLNIWNFMVHEMLEPGLKIFTITLLACEMSAIVQ